MQSDYSLTKDQYLDSISLWDDILVHGCNCVVSAPMGSGKSTSILKKLCQTNRPFVYAAPTIPVAENLFSSVSLPTLELFHANVDKEPTGSHVLTIWDHAPTFADKDTILVVDEWHSLIKHYGFRNETIDALISHFPATKQVIGLTGTMIEQVLPGFRIISVDSKRNPREAEQVMTIDPLGSVLEHIHTNPDVLHLVCAFNKKYCRRLKTMLIHTGYTDQQIFLLTKDTQSEGRDKRPIETILNDAKTRVIITTYSEGLSVKRAPWHVHVVAVGNQHPSALDISQVSNRVRISDPRNGVFVYSKVTEYYPGHQSHPLWDPDNLDGRVNESHLNQQILRHANNLRSINYGHADKHSPNVSRTPPDAFNSKPIPPYPYSNSEEWGRLLDRNNNLNPLGIANVTDRVTTILSHTSRQDLVYRCKEYGIDLRWNNKYGFIWSLPPRLQTTVAFRSNKETSRIIDAIVESRPLIPFSELLAKTNLLLQFFEPSDIPRIILNENKTTRSWNRFFNRLTTVVSRDTTLKEVRAELERTFPVGSEIDLSKAREIFQRHKHPHFSSIETQTRRTCELFLTLFNSRKRKGGPNIIKVKSHRPFTYPLLVDNAETSDAPQMVKIDDAGSAASN